MPKRTVNKRELSFDKSLFKELPYNNFHGDLAQLHGQFNNSVLASKTTRNNLHKLIYDLSLLNFNTNLDVNINPYENLSELIKKFNAKRFLEHIYKSERCFGATLRHYQLEVKK